MRKNKTSRIRAKLGKRRINADRFMDSKKIKTQDYAELEKLNKLIIDQN